MTWFVPVRSSQPAKVLILSGLNREHAYAVLAHELGHIWIARQGVEFASETDLEGTCELVQWLWLWRRSHKQFARHRRQRIQDNPDPIYGDGLRSALVAFQMYGSLQAVAQHARLKCSLPRDSNTTGPTGPPA